MITRSVRRALVLLAAGLLGLAVTGCSHDKYVIVTVVGGPGVDGVTFAELRVVFVNGGTGSAPVLIAATPPLPTNFSGSIPAAMLGDITVTIDALDGAGSVVATGEATTPIAGDLTTVTVTLQVTAPPNCGDGVLDTDENEQCDDGTAFNLPSADCTPVCRDNVCGDTYEHATSEECDDGNSTAGDGCFGCMIEIPLGCGDGTVEGAEMCDDGAANGPGADCTPLCTNNVCGDGFQHATLEECDDGNTMAGDGCNATCMNEVVLPFCGDGMVNDPSEECDDGNSSDSDDCPGTCLLAFCGDGFIWSTGTGIEECEDAMPGSNLDGCYDDCTAPGPTAALGLVEPDFASATVHGGSNFDNLGSRFGSARRSPIASGDFDGDGLTDLLFGSPFADGPGDVRFECGEVYVIFGGDFGPTDSWDVAGTAFTAVDLTVYGRAPADFLGTSVAAGDVNGDGIDDLIMGAPGHDGPGALAEIGEVSVVLGAPALGGTIDLSAPGAGFLQIAGIDTFDQIGLAVESADLDLNGSDDIVIGVPYGDGPANARMEAGEAYALTGPLSGGVRNLASAGSTPNVTFYGAESFDNFGSTLALGDFNGDGFADVITGAPYADGPANVRPDCGEVYVFLSSAALPATQDVVLSAHDVLIYGVANFDNTASIATGDLTGDGLADLVIGAPSNNGRLFVELGRVTGPGVLTLDAAASAYEMVVDGSFSPMFGGSLLGYEVSVADLDANGDLDVVTSASYWAGPTGDEGAIFGIVNPTLSLGAVTTYSIAPGAPLRPDVTILRGSEFTSIAGVGVGDFNNDGNPDFAMASAYLDAGAASERTDAGKVFVYYPGPGALVPAPACADGIDNDGDSWADTADAGCEAFDDLSELLGTTCDDAVDNDADGVTDFPAEPGCTGITDTDETDPAVPPQCSDGADNDADGLTDYPSDTSCGYAAQDDEACGFFGSDSFGYVGCEDVPFITPCEDISGTGTLVPGLSDDTTTSILLPFTFDFYGTPRSSVEVISNGKLGFPGTTTYSETCTIEPETIAVWWDDLYPPDGGAVRYQTFGVAPLRHFNVQWNLPHITGTFPDTLDVRVRLFEGTNDIEVCYVDTSFGVAYPGLNDGISATAGIGGPSGENIVYSCDMPVLTPGRHLVYNHP